MEKGKRKNVKLEVSVDLAPSDPKPDQKGVIYAFDSKNRLVGRKSLPSGKGGKVELSLSAELRQEKLRIIIGPELSEAVIHDQKCLAVKLPMGKRPEPPITPGMVLKKGGTEKRLRMSDRVMKTDMKVSADRFRLWGQCSCTVRGRLVKQVEMPDGSIREMGVYQACIYIYEVDRVYYVIEQLPELELLRIRDELIEIFRQWPPDPFPPEPVPPDPWPPGPEPFRSEIPGIRAVKWALPQVHTALKEKKLAEFEPVFTSQSAVALRRELLARADKLIPYLCFMPHVYGFFDKDFITCTCTDSSGYFEREITYSCLDDKPDLYFTAHQCIGGNWVTLYDPGLRCHVHWNYACGSEVLLVTDEPGAILGVEENIDPPADVYTWVEPHGIGNANLHVINDDGTMDYTHNEQPIEGAPFGARLRFRMGKSNNIPNNEVYYYRLQYRQGTGGQWHESLEPVTRHYIHEEDGKITFPTVALGPKPVNGMHLYRFKPRKPKDLDSSLDEDMDQWPDETWFGSDLDAGYFNTVKFPGGIENAHGLYQIKIEVYDINGNIVNPYEANPKFEFIKPITKDSPNQATETDVTDVADRDDEGFIFNLVIDNRSCTAAIDLPLVDGELQSESECGFLTYETSDDVKISFTASHPGNHAIASFTLKRGSSNAAGGNMNLSWEEVASPSPGDSVSNGYTNDNDGDFHKTVGVATLLGPCTNAAFAERLHVYAKAFNGFHRIAWYDGRYYDASDLRAFALALDDSE